MQPQSSSPEKRWPSQMENLITCPKCGVVYDTRFLAEHCRMVDGEGYHCYNCNALLVSI